MTPISLGGRRSAVSDQIYRHLGELLRSRHIAPGARLNVERLARQLQVSNTPVRRALLRLESEGLVTRDPGRGFEASPLLDSRAISEFFDYRLLIEPATAARAARRGTSEEIAELLAACDAAFDAIRSGDPVATLLPQWDVELHLAIARMARSKMIMENLATTLEQTSRYHGYGQPGATLEAWSEHRAAVQAIAAREPQAAAHAMQRHLICGRDRILTAFPPSESTIRPH